LSHTKIKFTYECFSSRNREASRADLKLAYYLTRRQFGKVLTPVKVHSARLPPAFGLFYSDKKLTLSPEFVLLIREQVARINVCLFCMDVARSFTIKASMNQARFDALKQYRTSNLFSEAERAALDYVTELTREEKGQPGYLCPHGPPFLRTGDLRDRLARGHRTCLQHDKHRPEHPFGHALRHEPEEVGTRDPIKLRESVLPPREGVLR
jgi:hypothetical protein